MYDALTKFRGENPEPLHETVSVLSYEVGHMMDHVMHMLWASKNSDVHRGFLKSELMDAIAQCDILCESLGCNFDEMREMGREKAMERFTGKEPND